MGDPDDADDELDSRKPAGLKRSGSIAKALRPRLLGGRSKLNIQFAMPSGANVHHKSHKILLHAMSQSLGVPSSSFDDHDFAGRGAKRLRYCCFVFLVASVFSFTIWKFYKIASKRKYVEIGHEVFTWKGGESALPLIAFEPLGAGHKFEARIESIPAGNGSAKKSTTVPVKKCDIDHQGSMKKRIIMKTSWHPQRNLSAHRLNGAWNIWRRPIQVCEIGHSAVKQCIRRLRQHTVPDSFGLLQPGV